VPSRHAAELERVSLDFGRYGVIVIVILWVEWIGCMFSVLVGGSLVGGLRDLRGVGGKGRCEDVIRMDPEYI